MDFRDLMGWRWPPRADVSGQSGAEEPLRVLQADINRAFEAFWRNMPTTSFRANWEMTVQPSEPRIDLVETDEGFEVSAEIPGLKESDIEVSISEDCVTIRAEKVAERDRELGGYRINERLYGTVHRSVPLPAAVDQDGVKASYTNGVLTISIPKRASSSANSQHIPINKS